MRALIAILCASLAGGAGQDPKRSKATDARAAHLRRAIVDINRLGAEDPWAGEYYHGDGLGVNVTLELAPAAGFLFEWHGCLGLYDRNFGAVTLAGEHIRLFPELPNTRKGFEGIPLEFTPVRWGPRRYLVASDGLLAFCNAVNSGMEPRSAMHGAFLLREGGEAQGVSGAPELPHEYDYCPLPLEAIVSGQGSKGQVVTMGARRRPKLDSGQPPSQDQHRRTP